MFLRLPINIREDNMTYTLEVIPDECKDDIGHLLEKFRNTTGWKSDKLSQLKNIIQILKESGYEKLFLKEWRYNVGKVGNSYLYKVSEKRRGLFKKYRGKLVRVICIESGRFDRTVMIKAMN